MIAYSLEGIARRFAEGRRSRRALASGVGPAPEADAAGTPTTGEAASTPDTSKKTQFLFVQPFQHGSIAPLASKDGAYSLTLAQGLGQTVYFSNRPERIVGATPTPQFLDGLGFTPDNPPNAALILQAGPNDEDIAVVTLANPRYDDATHTATYDVQVLQHHEKTLDFGFQEQTTDLALLHPAFGTAHPLSTTVRTTGSIAATSIAPKSTSTGRWGSAGTTPSVCRASPTGSPNPPTTQPETTGSRGVIRNSLFAPENATSGTGERRFG